MPLPVIAAIAASVGVPSPGELQEAFASAGWWAPLLFTAMYAAATLSALPKAIFTLAAGPPSASARAWSWWSSARPPVQQRPSASAVLSAVTPATR